MSTLAAAFAEVCPDAKQPETRFVSLYARVPFYGGPEEGGWWGEDVVLCAYHRVRTDEDAELVRERVLKRAKELTDDSRREHGERCLREIEWAEARGLNPDFMPEIDGESTYFVVIEDLPGSIESRGSRNWDE